MWSMFDETQCKSGSFSSEGQKPSRAQALKNGGFCPNEHTTFGRYVNLSGRRLQPDEEEVLASFVQMGSTSDLAIAMLF